MVKCAICGREFNKIAPMHLRTHNITTQEYREKYGEKGIANTKHLFKKKHYESIDIYSMQKYFNRLDSEIEKGKGTSYGSKWRSSVI